jgi:hypothetical protein
MTPPTGSGSSGGWWTPRDPDLGRTRTTKALGHRDWNWFASYAGSTQAPADLEAATSPWAGHPITAKDRHDRTLGIPARDICMWPSADTASPSGRTMSDSVGDQRRQDRASAVIEELRSLPRPASPTDVSPATVAKVLADLAPLVHGRSQPAQYHAITRVAETFGLPSTAVLALARDTGTLIARTTHAHALRLPGEPALNRLLHADLPLAAELMLARARLAWATTHSDPDLPRVWILANGLHHAIPADVLLNQPATSHGPIARLIPEHHDLIGWHGIHTAIDQLEATVHAAREGHRWLATTGGRPAADAAEPRLLALGVLHLTHPRMAHELARAGLTAIDLSRIRTIAESVQEPRHILDLSDTALKAVCDRNGWLHGTPDERTQRELVERHTGAVLTDDLRNRVAAGDTIALTTAIINAAPNDADLDRATWRHDPPAPDVAQSRRLLDLASREALHHFAGYHINPHPNRAAAITARFPDRLANRGLITTPDQLLRAPDQRAPGYQTQAELDLGI